MLAPDIAAPLIKILTRNVVSPGDIADACAVNADLAQDRQFALARPATTAFNTNQIRSQGSLRRLNIQARDQPTKSTVPAEGRVNRALT